MVLNMFIANTKYYTLFPAGVNTFFSSLKIQISQFKEKKLPEGSLKWYPIGGRHVDSVQHQLGTIFLSGNA